MGLSLWMPLQCFLDPLVEDLSFLVWPQGPQDEDLPLVHSSPRAISSQPWLVLGAVSALGVVIHTPVECRGG